MNIKNCRKCGKMFSYAFGPIICQDCLSAQEEIFQKAKKYVQDNKGCDIQELADNVDVEVQQIRQWIREERLQFSDDSPIRIACESCGAMIRSGRYCDVCKNNMARNLGNSVGLNRAPKAQPEANRRTADGNKMRFI